VHRCHAPEARLLRTQVLYLRGRLPQAEAAARRCLALLQQAAVGPHGSDAARGGAAVAARLRLGAILMGGRQGTWLPPHESEPQAIASAWQFTCRPLACTHAG